jgi:hypothetical protein
VQWRGASAQADPSRQFLFARVHICTTARHIIRNIRVVLSHFRRKPHDLCTIAPPVRSSCPARCSTGRRSSKPRTSAGTVRFGEDSTMTPDRRNRNGCKRCGCSTPQFFGLPATLQHYSLDRTKRKGRTIGLRLDVAFKFSLSRLKFSQFLPEIRNLLGDNSKFSLSLFARQIF